MYIIKTDKAPAAIGPYSQAVEANGFVFVSGQLGLDAATGEMVQGVKEQTEKALTNIKNILGAAGLEMKNILKTTVFIKNMSDFPIVNEVYAGFFENNFPARACIEVSALPKGGLVEVECVAVRQL